MTGGKNILIVAGEISGDLHGAALVREMRAICPGMSFWGFGGQKMRDAGVETLVDVSQLAVMGLFDVVRHIPRIRGYMRRLLEVAQKRRPALAILIDYPGFNLKLAPKLKKIGIPVGYYISPQLWAWAENRVRVVRKFVDRMVCILPFEKDFYARYGVEVDYVGHPFVDIVHPEMDEADFRRAVGIDGDFLALLPGSRDREITRLLPIMVRIRRRVAEYLGKEIPAVIASAPGKRPLIESLLPDDDFRVVENLTYSAMAYARAGLVASGSATLEAAILNLPAVVLYRVDPLSWAIGKRIIKTPHIALANLVAGERVYPEFVQDIPVEQVAGIVAGFFRDDSAVDSVRRKLETIRTKLGPGGAALRAGEIFCELAQKQGNC